MVYKNIYENNSNFDYPNYPFPYEYTKSGQAQMLKEREQSYSPTVETQSTNTNVQESNTGSNQKTNLGKLLPLIKAMNTKGKLTPQDMMKTFMPLMDENSKNLGELISAFDGLSKTQHTHSSKIEEYSKIEQEE